MDGNSVKMSVGDNNHAFKLTINFIGYSLESWRVANIFFLNAVNGHINRAEIVFWIYQGIPLRSDFAIFESGDSDRTNGCHVSICSFDINSNKFCRHNIPSFV